MRKSSHTPEDQDPSFTDRRAFMGRISRIGILGIAGGMLIHDVREGWAAPQPSDPGQQKDPKEEGECDNCHCHCTCDCDCDCGCACECTCKECSCGCTCPTTLTDQVKSSDKINLDHAADNTVHVANSGGTINGPLQGKFESKEKAGLDGSLENNGQSLANGVAKYKKENTQNPRKGSSLRSLLGLRYTP
ncbi:MAG: hypothetical protein ACYTG7_15580 [Planctomycetota bacterium]|jgi:hypothetical protein